MNVTISRQLVLVVVGAALVAGCSQTATEEVDAGAAENEVDLGTVENGVYRNEYFGMSITIPADWSIQDRESMTEATKAGARVVTGEDKNLQAVVKASEQQLVRLLMASKHPLGSPVLFNPSIACVAERVRHAPGIKRGSDFHFHTRRLLESGPLDVKFPKDVFSETINGVEFDVLYTETRLPTMIVKQKQYATIVKDYALLLAMSYTTEEEESSLKEILNSATFK